MYLLSSLTFPCLCVRDLMILWDDEPDQAKNARASRTKSKMSCCDCHNKTNHLSDRVCHRSFSCFIVAAIRFWGRVRRCHTKIDQDTSILGLPGKRANEVAKCKSQAQKVDNDYDGRGHPTNPTTSWCLPHITAPYSPVGRYEPVVSGE